MRHTDSRNIKYSRIYDGSGGKERPVSWARSLGPRIQWGEKDQEERERAEEERASVRRKRVFPPVDEFIEEKLGGL